MSSRFPARALGFLLTAALLGAAADAAAQSEMRTLSLEMYLDLESVSNPQISPDGSQVVYTRGWVDKMNDRRESSIWIMNADGSKNRFLVDGSGPLWSPDKRNRASSESRCARRTPQRTSVPRVGASSGPITTGTETRTSTWSTSPAPFSWIGPSWRPVRATAAAREEPADAPDGVKHPVKTVLDAFDARRASGLTAQRIVAEVELRLSIFDAQ